MLGEFRRRLENYEGSLIIGVAGDSGSGKSTFTRSISNLLGNDLVSFFSLDDYHTEDRETRMKTGHLPLDPSINNLALAAEHLKTIRRGKAVIKPVYNHKTGKFGPQEVFEPRKIVIVEGLHTLYDELRDLLDLKIYVDPSKRIKWRWKIKRDVGERGYDEEKVIKEIQRREPLYKRYIDFQKIYADIVIKIDESKFNVDNSYFVEIIMKTLDFSLSNIDMNLDISSLINTSRKPMQLSYRDDFYYMKKVSKLSFDGLIPREAIESLENKIKEYTGFLDNYIIERSEYVNGIQIAQLLVAWYFVEMMNNIFREIERLS